MKLFEFILLLQLLLLIPLLLLLLLLLHLQILLCNKTPQIIINLFNYSTQINMFLLALAHNANNKLI